VKTTKKTTATATATATVTTSAALSFEEQLARLDDIVQALDAGTEPLASMLALYEEGMMLAKECSTFLSAAEQRVTVIQKQAATRTHDTAADDDSDDDAQ
jgi:exodeoxyribonuclease VII small subunit